MSFSDCLQLMLVLYIVEDLLEIFQIYAMVSFFCRHFPEQKVKATKCVAQSVLLAWHLCLTSDYICSLYYIHGVAVKSSYIVCGFHLCIKFKKMYEIMCQSKIPI